MTATATATAAQAIPAGTLVRYHGSKVSSHGRYRVQYAAVEGGKVRYDLTYTRFGIYAGADNIALQNVRPESLTVVAERR